MPAVPYIIDGPMNILGGEAEHVLPPLLEAIVNTGAYIDLEAGCNGRGPVVLAFEALGVPLPDVVAQWVENEVTESGDVNEGSAA